ncbi:MAG: Bug family tripartite tricarboxylate transporter substrate binding protein [Gammaproteobacteria bacterium]
MTLHALTRYLAGAICVLGLSAANGQYPEKPIEFVIPFAAGGGADIEGRTLAEEMSTHFGVPVVPVNRAGAGGAVAYSHVNNAAPDGYTVVWNSNSILTVTNLGNVPFGYDSLDHVGRVEFQPMVFAVSARSDWTDLGEFLADCKANPNRYKVANSGTGSATHLGALALMTAAGCEVIHLPIGIQRRNSTVLSGEADAMMGPLTGAINLARANRFRLLVSLSTERNPVIPDVPFAAEVGVPVDFDVFRGLSVPGGTPPEIMNALATAMTRAAESEAFMSLASEVGFTVAPLGVEAFEELLAAEDEKVAGIVRDAGLGNE